MKKFFLLIILIIVFLIIIFNKKWGNYSEEMVEGIIRATAGPTIISSYPKKNSLREAVEKNFDDNNIIFGIVVKNLKNGESYFFNEHKSFNAASLYKLWILATAFDQFEKGKLKEDEILSQNIAVLNEKFHIAQEEAEATAGQITLTTQEAIEKMIITSDNYAALLLSEELKLSTVKTFLKQNHFQESFLGEPPVTTAYDIALFFEKLYKGEIANQNNTDKMLNILKRQTLNHKLPKYLPQNTVIAHKTGEIDKVSHDAGIVYLPNNEYLIAVLSESNYPAEADDQIAKISQAVYQYFTEKK